jgi:hypothetical protein
MAFLSEYTKKSALATPTLLYVFFEELLKDKDLCLVRGDLVDGYIQHREADDVFQQIVMFYMTPDLYNEYVLPFNRDPSNFNYDNYCALMNLNKF